MNQLFGIRCPPSIQNSDGLNVFSAYSYETECQYDNNMFNLTAFCGKCARKNSNNFFGTISVPLTYNQVIEMFIFKKKSLFLLRNLDSFNNKTLI